MKILIPSYKRCGDVRPLEFASDIADEVIISTQTEAEYRMYEEAYSEVATVVLRDAHNASGNRNTLLMELRDGERAVMVDDDVKSILVCTGEKGNQARPVTRADLDEYFDAMEAAGAAVGGCYPIANPYFAYSRPRMTKNDMLVGDVMLFIGGCAMFNESYDACEDYELVLRTIARGGDVMRFNRLIAPTTSSGMKAALSGQTKGGLAEAYANGAHRDAIMRLAREYAPIAKLGRDRTSIRIDKRYV